MRYRSTWLLALALTVLSPLASAQLVPPAIPELDPGAGIIVDAQAALALGKALFWDEQAGSDGMACASCHFAAGADNRVRNQLSPGFKDASFVGGDKIFGSNKSDTGAIPPGHMPSGAVAGPNYTLTALDFPLHQLADYTNRNSPLISTTNDAVSSQGAYDADFFGVRIFGQQDLCSKADGTLFRAGKFPARQVEPRNTPTTINSAFYYSNFWDGRANNLFNGVGVFGMRDIAGDPNKRLVILDTAGSPTLGYLQLRNASLASQAVGPPLSALEMSCSGRTFAGLGRKLLTTIPLLRQKVVTTDSVLGSYASTASKGTGLKFEHTYAALIKRAFDPKYWAAAERFSIQGGALSVNRFGYTQMETNFSMFWGISIMMYERTLISDQSRFDSWFASCRPVTTNTAGTTVPIGNPTVTCRDGSAPESHGLTAQEILGFALFNNGGTGIRNAGNPACAGCHGPVANPQAAPAAVILPVMSEAAYISGQTNPFTPIERSRADVVSEYFDGTTHGVPEIVLPRAVATPTNTTQFNQVNAGMHDRGFFNIGVMISSADPGNGGLDPYGNSLSLARMLLIDEGGGSSVDSPMVITPATVTSPTIARRITLTGTLATTDEYNRCSAPNIIEGGGTPPLLGCIDVVTNSDGSTGYNPNTLGPPTTGTLDVSQEREMVDGGFKTPSLRNAGLTAPYFHSGNYSDLRSVIEFYARGGSRRSKSLEDAAHRGDTSGSGLLGKELFPSDSEHGTNVDFFIRDIKSTPEQIDAIVAFILTLTDPRVQCDQAPFDHPQLNIVHGHTTADKTPKDGKADDIKAVLPAVGATGYTPESGYCLPNKGDLFATGMQGRVGGPKPTPADL